jgi:hypothetical protein
VALNGRRVYDLPQYIYVRMKLRDPTMRLIVWRDPGYREVTASFADHRFGVSFRTFSRLR